MGSFALKVIIALTLSVLLILKVIGLAEVDDAWLWYGVSGLFCFHMLSDDKPWVFKCNCEKEKTD